MQITKRARAIALAAVALGSTALTPLVSNATVITAWTFENDAIAVNNNPAPSTGSGTASALGMGIYPTPQDGTNTDDVLKGKNSDTGTNTVADTTQTWRVRAQATSPNAANGWSSLAPIATQGAEFAMNPGTNTSVAVSFDWYATTQGEANLELEYTTDGTDFINVPLTLSGSDAGVVVMTGNAVDTNTTQGSYVSDNILNAGEAATAGQDWFTDLTATITDPNMLNDVDFAIEIVNASTGADDVSTQGTALNNSSGNWRFDNVSVSTVPEPASVGLLALGAIGLAARRRVRR